tara:strand:- start:602 stop:1606 length:1005 start_codon:yes stop_codon:yes gene_type:complete
MTDEGNKYAQQELEINLPNSNFKDEWVDSLCEKLTNLNTPLFFSDSLIFYNIVAWRNLLLKKAYLEIRRLTEIEKSQEKNAKKLALLRSLSPMGLQKLAEVTKTYSSLSDFVAVLIHLFGKKFACMILTLHQLEGIDESYLIGYYASDEDDDFRHDFYQDFPFYEPWRWRENQNSRHFNEKNMLLIKEVDKLRNINADSKIEAQKLRDKITDLEARLIDECVENLLIINEQRGKIEEYSEYAKSMEDLLELIPGKPLDSPKNLQIFIEERKSLERLLQHKDWRISELNDEKNRLASSLSQAYRNKDVGTSPAFITGLLMGSLIAFFLYLAFGST